MIDVNSAYGSLNNARSGQSNKISKLKIGNTTYSIKDSALDSVVSAMSSAGGGGIGPGIYPVMTYTWNNISTVAIAPGQVCDFGTITVTNHVTVQFMPLPTQTYDPNTYYSEYIIRFKIGDNVSASSLSDIQILLPSTVKYLNGEYPTFTAGHYYEMNICQNLCVIGDFSECADAPQYGGDDDSSSYY